MSKREENLAKMQIAYNEAEIRRIQEGRCEDCNKKHHSTILGKCKSCGKVKELGACEGRFGFELCDDCI